MAPSAKYLNFVFLLYLISSLQIQARDSQFFSKVTHNNNDSNNSSIINNNDKETGLPEREELSHTQHEEPSFTSENHNGHGLYRHGSEQFPPTTANDAYYTSGNFPEKSTADEYPGGSYNYKEFNTGYPNNNNNEYETKQQGMSNTRYVDMAYLNNNYYNGYETKQPSMRDNNYYNGYETKQPSLRDTRYVDTAYINNNNNNYNGHVSKPQGMSDTRFLENGKYFYDIKNEEPYRHGVAYQNMYGADANNNEKTYEVNNSMERYQNQDEEYQERQEYVP